MKHQKGCRTFFTFQLAFCPPVHDPTGYKSRDKAQKAAQQKHRVETEDLLQQHGKPEIKRRLVRIRHTMVVESDEVAVGKGVIYNVKVSELIGGGELPQCHQREKHREYENIYGGSPFHHESSLTGCSSGEVFAFSSASLFFCLWRIIRFLV